MTASVQPEILPPRAVGQSIPRKEDVRFITGTAAFVDDIAMPRMVHAAVVRSPFPHARIDRVDATEALELPGVIAFYGAAEIAGRVKPFPELYLDDLSSAMYERASLQIESCPMPPLPTERARWVGQPVGVIVATDRYIAEDARELVDVDYEPLPAIVGHAAALDPDAPVLHESVGHNAQHRYSVASGNVEEVFANAPHSLHVRLAMGRQLGSPIETRGIVAALDPANERLTVWATTNRPFLLRTLITETLDIPTDNVRVVAPDIGGCFGGGIFAEDSLIPYIARELGRPVKWIEDRVENLQSTRHGRDQVHDIDVAFDGEGRILALRDDFTVDVGAYNHYAITVSYNVAAHLCGQFKLDSVSVTCTGVFSNKAPAAPVRGAGRPEAVYVMDRIVDLIADELGLDPVSVRFLNLVAPEDMPYVVGLPYRDGIDIVYERGDFPGQLRQALKAIDYDGWKAKAAAAKSHGTHRIGIGVSSFVEASGVGPFEGAIARIDRTGHAHVYTGANSHGQGLATTLAQVAADQLCLTPDDVTVWPCDTAAIPHGVGTFASRSAITAGNAVALAAALLRDKILAVAGAALEAGSADLVLEGGSVSVRGARDRSMSLRDVALAAAPGRASMVPEGDEPGLEARFYYVPPTVAWASGTHAVVVNVDVETGFVKLLDYVSVDECGRMLNPMVVEGQVHGGIAHGIGNGMLEVAQYDEDGQFLAGTYMDYLVPTSSDVPPIRVEHQEFPTALNPLGVKGVGEGGAASPPAAIANAVVDALRPLRVRITTAPLTPQMVLAAIGEARRDAGS
jgi:carbon-monoxide dehydrogenase large subunit